MFEISEKSYTRDNLLADLRAGLTPLEAAKKKWTAIIEGGEDFGTYSCACCETYFDDKNPRNCLSICPLGGSDGCCSGDYSRWVRHQNEEHMHEYISYAVRCPECEDIARNILAIIETRLERQLKTV